MKPSGGKTPSLARQSQYNINALDQIRKELNKYAHTDQNTLQQLKLQNGRVDISHDGQPSINGHSSKVPHGGLVIRKPSIERELQSLHIHRGSPALDSGAGSSRSDSPHSHQQLVSSRASTGQYSPSPCPSNFSDAPPPPPPRCSSTPPTPPPVPANVQQLFKRMASPAAPPTRPVPLASQSPARGTSPVSTNTNLRQPIIVQNGPQAQQQLSHQIQALNMYQSGNNGEPPPPYPIITGAPPSYTVSIQSRQSPTQSTSDYRKSPSSGIYSGTSAGSPSPITIPTQPQHSSMARPVPLPVWSARQTKTQQPVIMQSVKSTQVQKPVLQTAVAPTAPTTPPICTSPVLTTTAPPSYASSIQQKAQVATTVTTNSQKPPAPAIPNSSSTPPSTPSISNSLPVNGNSNIVPTTEPPSYASTMQAFMAQSSSHQTRQLPPPPPYSTNTNNNNNNNGNNNNESDNANLTTIPPLPPNAISTKNNNNSAQVNGHDTGSGGAQDGPVNNKIKHQSPIPERKNVSKEKEEERKENRMKHYSPQAFKFYMEQHVENVLKSYRQRTIRKSQLEREMEKIGLSEEAQAQMRKMLSQKESNYIRLKRAKMDKTMFVRIKHIGVGAFGEVSLVRKVDTTNHFYAMKTLRKADVLKKNQVAHVKAERDILAEADNEWVVKLYYSFQDKDNLYFVMDYIPGGDLMSLLIKKGIFEEKLSQFYIAELTCAVESVHKMGFIHRDIKPDNILIDRDGHIKLTDFGLCTGFRWTHDSKYYQKHGDHARQDSMEPWEEEEGKKPTVLERRRARENHRCLAHSLVGTPNYIAPEVLERSGYTQLCDWWSVGVILYEMLVGQPPFLAATPIETQQKVINWEKTLHIPAIPKLSQESMDLIRRLCSAPDRRLGKNADEVKMHKFFRGIDFDSGLRKQQAPFIPKIEHPTDTSNFDPIDPDKLHNSSSDSNKSNDDFMDTGKPFHGFFEFTFRRFFDDNSKSGNGDGEGCYV